MQMAQRGLGDDSPESKAGLSDERLTERTESLRIAATVLETVISSSTSARRGGGSIVVKELIVTVGEAMGIENPGFGDFPQIRRRMEEAMDTVTGLVASETQTPQDAGERQRTPPPPPEPPPADVGHPETGGGLGFLTK